MPSCPFDILYPLSGLTLIDRQMFALLCCLLTWQLVSYYQTQLTSTAVLSFQHEALLGDLITRANYNYSSLISTLFVGIFICNFSGLLPYTQTVTSQLLFTLVLSFLVMFIIWVHTIVDNKILLLNHFLPNGAPLILIPFIILIELISNLSRLISLSVRLFANMTSGHALLKILAGFGVGALSLVGV